MSENSDPYAMRPLGSMSYIIARHIRMLSDKLRPFGLTTPMWRTLDALYNRDGRNIGEIAEYTAFERSYISRIVDRLEKQNLIKRMEVSIDKRFASVNLTNKGRKLYLQTKPLVENAHQLVREGLSTDEYDTLSRLLEKVLDHVRRPS